MTCISLSLVLSRFWCSDYIYIFDWLNNSKKLSRVKTGLSDKINMKVSVLGWVMLMSTPEGPWLPRIKVSQVTCSSPPVLDQWEAWRGEHWPIRGWLRAGTDQSAARCHPTPSKHQQNNNHQNNTAAEKHESNMTYWEIWIKSTTNHWIKVNLIDWYDWPMVKYFWSGICGW